MTIPNPFASSSTRRLVLGTLALLVACAVVLVPSAQSDAGWRIIPIIDDEYGLCAHVDDGNERIIVPTDRAGDLQAATGLAPVAMPVRDAILSHPPAGAGHTICWQDATPAGNVLAVMAAHGYDVATHVVPLPGFQVAQRFD